MWPSHYPSFVPPYVAWSFPPWLYIIFLHFSQDWPNWPPPFVFSTKFQNCSCISDLLCEVSSFQHYATLRSKCNTLLLSSLNLSPVLLVNSFFLLQSDKNIGNFTWIITKGYCSPWCYSPIKAPSSEMVSES